MLFIQSIKNWWRVREDRNRHIFRYFDGHKWHRADPMQIGMKLEEVCPELQDILDVIAKDASKAPIGPVRDDLMAQKKEASIKLDRAAREVFNLKPLTDTGGVTGGEAVGTLTRYFLFMEELAREAQLFTESP